MNLQLFNTQYFDSQYFNSEYWGGDIHGDNIDLRATWTPSVSTDVVFQKVRWYVNGSLFSEANLYPTDTERLFSTDGGIPIEGDTIRVEVQPNDGHNYGTMEYAEISIGFDPPEPITTLNLSFEPLTFSNDYVSLSLSSDGRLKTLLDKQSGKNYALNHPAFSVVYDINKRSFATSIIKEGDLLKIEYSNGSTSKIKFEARPSHFLIEVVEVSPDIEKFSFDFIVKRLETVATAFNATYDNEFGMCLLSASLSTYSHAAYNDDIYRLWASCKRLQDIVGVKFILVASPYDVWADAIIESEQDNGLPCPMLDGQWARISDQASLSYLFTLDTVESDVDKIIEYAKMGGFGTILIYEPNWVKGRGHYTINTTNFPDGIESLKRFVQKIHDAGLYVGVHLYPGISFNDSYISPIPDQRLFYVPCSRLAEPINTTDRTISLVEQPNIPPKNVKTNATPGRYLWVDDEIILYDPDQVEEGTPFKYLNCQRGMIGTSATVHAANTEVRSPVTRWGRFLVNINSTLMEEIAQNFADVFNFCEFDMVYWDGSDGLLDEYVDRTYYLNQEHKMFYEKIGYDVLYQVSTGTGYNFLWHIVPRSASADGYGDIKGYLDGRWGGIVLQKTNWIKSDIGWYYWKDAAMYDGMRPDQYEYVIAKAASIDASISLQTRVTALEDMPQSRQLMDMLGRWHAHKDGFDQATKDMLGELGKDFKLIDGNLYHAVYEEPIRLLGGETYSIDIESDLDCSLGIEIINRRENTESLVDPALTVNGENITLPCTLSPSEVLTSNAFEGIIHWWGGMEDPADPYAISGLDLHTGTNSISFDNISSSTLDIYLYRLWPS